MRPNDPTANGFVVQKSNSLFGGKAIYGFSMPNSSHEAIPRKHKVEYPTLVLLLSCLGTNVGVTKNMGQFKDRGDPCYQAVRAVLKEFVNLEEREP